MAGPRAYSNPEGESLYAYPLTIQGQLGSTVADHMARAFGNWMSDNAVDISVAVNTGVRAVDDCKVSRLSGSPPNHSANPAGWTVYLESDDNDNNYAYMHLESYDVSVGQRLRKGEVFGKSGAANGVPHLHFASEFGNPENIIEGAPAGGGGGNGGGGVGAGGTLDERTAKAAAFATYFNIEGLFDTANSIMLKGDKSLMNDKPLFPLIEQLTSASMRRFQSMPNGNFYAFYPDYFGGSKHRRPYWEVRDIEIVDGQIELSDDSLATHVFVVGDIVGAFDGVNGWDMDQTAGVINIFNAFQADFISGHGDQQRPGPVNKGKADIGEGSQSSRVIDHDEAVEFLKKYGARPYMEEAPMVRSAFYEAFLAYQKFCLLWAQQFSSQFQLTFMPELFPGGLVAFPDHKIQMFVEEVTHSFDYSTGFRTDVTFSSPASLDGKGKEHEGMIRAGSLDTSREN